ncbi:MAG: outer membrane beta-barrel protein [Gammaproteobacteria bacterium]|nr:outer membrane beta-barrel protein [Gammaproteobacteria bacterium]
MRKSGAAIILTGLLGVSATGNAHDLKAGTLELGGSLRASMTSSTIKIQGFEDLDQDSTSLDILGLYYVSDNLGLGLTWNYDATEFSSGGDSLEVTSNEVGPVVAYNISLNERASLKLIGAFLVASVEDDSVFGDGVTIDGNGWAVGGMISNFINDHMSVDASLVYESLSLEEDVSNTDVDLDGYTVGVGISVYF